MPFEIDHLFVCAAPGAPEVERVLALGMAEGSANVHAGQGTANRRIFFANAFLEFLWVHDEAQARGPQAAPMGLWERWARRASGACPFGVCLRGSEAGAVAPFPAWQARPPYLPPGRAIQVAESAGLLHEPMLFCLPWAVRPDRYPPEHGQPLEHFAGMGEITGVRITIPPGGSPSASLRAAERTGLIQLGHGPAPLMEVAFDGGRQGASADLRPELPLMLSW